MSDILRLYASGLSVREVARICGVHGRTVRRHTDAAGITRTKSEGMLLRHNPARTSDDDALVIKLSFAEIRIPYAPVQYFTGDR